MTDAQLSNALYTYIINTPDFKENILKQFGIKSDIVLDTGDSKKIYGFVGMGCGITYLKIDHRSKKAVQLKNIVYDVRRKVNNTIYNKWFSKNEHEAFEHFGCPIMAVLQQDQQCQIEFYHLVVKFAKEVLGIKRITYISNLD